MSNLVCGIVTNPFQIQDTQANLRGTGDNIVPANNLTIRIGTVSGGPYTAWISNPLAGTNTVGQSVQNVFGCGTSPPKLTPSTTYFWRVEERDAGNVLIDSSPECSFTTLAASDYLQCDPATPDWPSRNHVFSTLIDSIEAPCDGSLITKEYSTSPLGPWTTALDSDFNTSGPCSTFPNPTTYIGASSSVVATDTNGLVHNTDYYIRFVLQKGNGDPQEVQVCGPFKTKDYPLWACTPPFNVTATSGDVGYTFPPAAGSGAGGGTAQVQQQPAGCDQDSYVLKWGTTPGGPYPNTMPTITAPINPNWTLTGLTTGVPVYYVMEASEQLETNGIYQTTPECTFTPSAVAARTAQCDPATAITVNSATLNGTIGGIQAGDTYEFQYGTTLGGPYGTTVGPFAAANGPVSQPIAGLVPSANYYFVVVVKDSGAVVQATSGECNFTTTAAPPGSTVDCEPAAFISATSALLLGQVNNGNNVSQEAEITYGTTPGGPYPLTTGLIAFGAGNPEPVGGTVTGLTVNTTYYYVVLLWDVSGPQTLLDTSSECSFVTAPESAQCSGAINITSNSADLQYQLGGSQPGDTFNIQYGTTPGGPYGTTLGPFPAVDGVSTKPAAGLTPSTAYYFIVNIFDSGATLVNTSTECTFTTSTPAAETAQCDPATNIDSNSATLNGTLGGIVAGDQVRFRYGTAPGGPYGVTLGPVPAVNGPVSQPTGNSLAPSTTYYYVVDVLSAGNILLVTSGECTLNTQVVQNNVTDPASGITTTSVTLNGRAFSTEPGDTTEFIWGTTPGGPYPNTACAGTPTTQPANPDLASCPLAGLTPNTNYCYRLVTRNALNVVVATGNQVCFMTAANPPPTVVTNPPTAITSTCITFNGGGLFVPSGCTYAFEYGTTPGGPYPFTTNDGISTGASPENFSAPQCGLTPGTQYYYRALINCGGNKTFGPEVPVLTTNIIVDPCEPATAITPTSAILHATSQNAPAGYTYQFRYGTTPGGPYPFVVSGGASSGSSPDPYQASVAGLTPGTTYYYTSEVLNPAQQVVAGGGECTFATTGAIGPGGFVYWCGNLYDSANCVFVPSNDGGYFDCNQV